MPENNQSQYVTLKQFLARHPNLNESTVRRWVRSGRLPHCQPGGPKTLILVPEDALQRMEQSGEQRAHADRSGNDAKPLSDSSTKAVRKPSWMKGLKQTRQTKEENA